MANWNDGNRDDNRPKDGQHEPWLDDEDDSVGEEEARTDFADLSEPAQLELGDDDARLPWLEGDDDFEEQGGYGTGQVVTLLLLGLVAIGVIVGGIWWALRDKPESAMVADGGVIAAPKEPYKVRPENPGGEIVAGTGDTSFAVAEGQSRLVQIDDKPVPAPKPGFEAVSKPGASAPPTSAATAAPVSGVGVQVGAYSTREAAEKGWATLQQRYTALSGVSHRIVEGQADIGKVYRLQAVPGSAAAAQSLCSGLKAAGLSCQVKN